ncbi:ammonium transporter [Acinetobacter gerneri]|uniref:Ammonium transporter n=1 Tax=Acinetobacter gerneri TaxID=202952 RepID=A0AAW8JMG0_9GAMM|nr:ammonium transporter [Acinetobacter gerneri]MDQ9012004.1 ammonium transporter [Acinetobacter gerneri]MDQ9016101.1 ammonium transporter [Acinetobacter gerneri]MDQ9027280.1 ammonium transporter [Acinetobacter gerneri]MDQ9054581.1 ammonium transporter [Acinetobacter gerneri]MDQ9062232.1 ammonium transporter [Acinetobacter gerneri]
MKVFKYLIYLSVLVFSPQVFAVDEYTPNDLAAFNLLPNIYLLILGGVFVLMMQAGFAIIEGGYEKNSRSFYGLLINYLSAILGSAFFGVFCFFISTKLGADNQYFVSKPLQGWHWNLVFFYTLMATTLTTVVGRIIPSSSSLFTFWAVGVVISGLIFPVISSWAWGNLFFDGGWLKHYGFIDFAGSTVVHSTSAWIVLAGYFVLKPEQKEQLVKRDIMFDDYKILSIALAGFILWLAWSGLNVGYITAIPVKVIDVVINTVVALLGAVLSSLVLAKVFLKKSSWESMIKSAIGGLVAITASCGFIDAYAAGFVGIIAGIITVYVPSLLSRWIDAKNIREVITIHGFCGIWGTLAVSFSTDRIIELTNRATILEQSVGIVVAFLWSFTVAFIAFKAICWLKEMRLRLKVKND